jgi:hypothetical protein
MGGMAAEPLRSDGEDGGPAVELPVVAEVGVVVAPPHSGPPRVGAHNDLRHATGMLSGGGCLYLLTTRDGLQVTRPRRKITPGCLQCVNTISEELLCCAVDLFTWWYRVRDGTLSRSTFQRYVAELRPWVRSQLEAGASSGRAKTAGPCLETLAVEPSL